MALEILIISFSVVITSGLITLALFMKKLLAENQATSRHMVKEIRLVSEKAFTQLKAQSVEQAVAASELENQYKLQRDAYKDELAKASKAAEEYKEFGQAANVEPEEEYFTDLDGNQYKRSDLLVETV
ncbi:MAG: hypothetical protein NWE76_05685 [Candidatus Bathyarchaeota archaeon]|nr:hypothetical protein [Candidatus Bathyarchaeota archaeon]